MHVTASSPENSLHSLSFIVIYAWFSHFIVCALDFLRICGKKSELQMSNRKTKRRNNETRKERKLISLLSISIGFNGDDGKNSMHSIDKWRMNTAKSRFGMHSMRHIIIFFLLCHFAWGCCCSCCYFFLMSSCRMPSNNNKYDGIKISSSSTLENIFVLVTLPSFAINFIWLPSNQEWNFPDKTTNGNIICENRK